MKFIVDEQLPWRLVNWLTKQGHDAYHATSLRSGIKIPDSLICEKSIQEQRIVVSKDVDFFNRFVFHREPFKLVYLTTGNMNNKDLLALLEANWDTLENLLQSHYVIEVNQENILIRF